MGTKDNHALLARAQQGDPSAIKSLLSLHRERLKAMVVAYLDSSVRSRVDPSDVVQETLIHAAVRLPDYARDQPIPFYPWLRKLAKERVYTIHREHIHVQRRSVQREEAAVGGVSDESVCSLAERMVDPASSPISAAIKRERKDLLLAQLRNLSAEDQELLNMRFSEQMPVSEIASSLGISQSAVKSRLVRALERLNQRLENQLG